MNAKPIVRPALLLAALWLAERGAAQQPQLQFWQRVFLSTQATAALPWNVYGPVGQVFVLLADVAPGQTVVLGQPFDLAFTPALLPLLAGVVGPSGSTGGSLPFAPSSLPVGQAIFCQFGAFDAGLGLASLTASNVDSFATHPSPYAIVAPFTSPGSFPAMTGVFDHAVHNRLQALPPRTRTVRPLPPEAIALPIVAPFEPLHPSGSRFQLALRAADLDANGLPERLTAVRWRPLFGAVVAESYPQFELVAAHSDVVPDYTIDPFTALPVAPGSGLAVQFAANPIAASAVSVINGAYQVLPSNLTANGYLPFPAPQQPFDYDGVHTLLLETRCSPTPGLGAPQNHGVIYQMGFSSPQPFATVYASAGWNGQPSPLPPLSATSGAGGSYTYDWELEFVRTASLATSAWLLSGLVDYQPPILSAFVPPGTSIEVEFRGALDPIGTGATAWSTNQDVADGYPNLQFRVRMTANAATNAVPWLDLLIVPVS
ncbi:MAG TPA: hypothetical protein VFZ65_06085 [Planctomycetota bacterium]|nr:hypothetical protein [Planctomycetota bacterium]